ncbi:MAG: YbhB/YbcL family Raf kinase inhibitor-like protein [Burkholderiales bacterium]|nr:YbhB/YbcL family Raf kinase inhibitor-like protein [Burkholderiales bacterium]GIK85038.1 MAG: phosphatidylethanolamine-binding protein [Betaproteobacteria bacterium]
MKLATTAFADMAPIPAQYAFGRPDPAAHIALSGNRNPGFQWSGAPAGTKSFALICNDPDVPSKPDGVNQEGHVVPRSLPRVDFCHWVLIDLPAAATSIAEGAHSDGVKARGKPGPAAPDGGRHGVNDYTAWFAGDPAMAGDYYGYDGPCPPWNDELPHRYEFTLYALDVTTLEVPTRFTCADVRKAMQGHVLARATVTGRYTLNPGVSL